jgi:tetratricopeptide (TPR) repeat protein
MKKKFVFCTLLLMLMTTFVGCNIFSFSGPEDSKSSGYDGLEALQDGDYDKAIEEYTKVLDDEPFNPEAHWGLAKAYIRRTGYTTLSIMAEMSSFESEGSLPFMNEPVEDANALYEGVIAANVHLKSIFDGESSNIELNDSTIALDYTGTLALQGILLLRDTNGDSHIDGNDYDLNALFDMSGDFSMDNNWFNISQADQEAMYDNLAGLLTESGEVLFFFIDMMFAEDDTTGSGFNTENLQGVIDDILLGFEDFTGFGGPGPDSMDRPNEYYEFINGGQE